MIQCRIMLNKRCNRDCSYCINKHKDILDTFKPVYIDDILKSDYSSYCITGGEPILDFEKLVHLIKYIKYKNPIANIYLYSNGDLIKFKDVKELKRIGLTSINIGLHDNKIADFQFTFYKMLNDIIPIRLHRNIDQVDDKILNFCKDYNIGLKKWVMDKCDTEIEDRFYLKGF